MKIIETERFRKSLRKLTNPARKKVQKQFRLFLENLFHPSLNTEKLEPKHKNIWSFRIDRSLRVIFTFVGNEKILLLDIGPPQVRARTETHINTHVIYS